MSESFVQIPPNSTGALVRTELLTVAGNQVMMEVGVIGDPNTSGNLLAIDSSGRITANINGTVPVSGSINLSQVGGSNIALGQTTMANSMPVVVASNQSAIPVMIPTNSTINLTQIGGVAVTTGASGLLQTSIVGNSGGIMDAAGQNAASPANSLLVAAQYNASPTTVTSGHISPLQMDSSGSLLVHITAGAGSGGTAEADEATFTPSTTNITPVGGIYNTGSISLSSGQAGAFRMTADRALWANTQEVAGSTVSTAASGVQKVGIVGAAGGVFDAIGQNVTSAANSILVGAQFNTSPTTLDSGNMSPLQMDNAGSLLVHITAGAGSGGTALADEASFTEGVTNFTPIGGYYKTSPAALTTGEGGSVSLTAARALFTDIHSVAGTVLGAISNFGTSPTGVAVPGVNASLFIGTTVASAAASGVQKVGIVGNAGAAMDAAGQNAASPANSLLVAGQFNTSPTTITTGNMSPLQLDNAGSLLVHITAGAGSGGTAIADEATFTEGTTSFTPMGGYFKTSPTALTTGQAGAVSMTASRAMFVNVNDVAGNAIAVGNGVTGTGTQRVTISSDSTGQVTLAAGANTIGTVSATQGTSPWVVGQGTAANLNATVVFPSAQAVTITGHAGGVFDATGQNATSPANEILVGGQFNTSPTTITSGNISPLQLDSSGNLKTNTSLSVSGNNGLPITIPEIVQKTSNISSGSVASLAKAFVSNNTAGNTIVVTCGVGNNSNPTIADTQGNTYFLTEYLPNGTAFGIGVFFANNIAAGANTVTVTNGGSNASIAMEIYELSGVITVAPAYARGEIPADSGTSIGNSGTASTVFAPRTSNELAIGAVGLGTAAQTISFSTPNIINDSGQLNPTTPAGLYSMASFSSYTGLGGVFGPTATFTSEPWVMNVVCFNGPAVPISGQVSVLGQYNSATPSLTSGQNNPFQVDSSGSLLVHITAGAGSGGTADADESTFTEGTTSITPIGGYYKTSPTPLTTGQLGAVAMTADRSFFVNLNRVGGNTITLGQTVAGNCIPVVLPSATTVPVTQSGNWTSRIVGNIGAVIDGVPGSAIPANAIQIGGSDGTNLRTIATDSGGQVKVLVENNVSTQAVGNGTILSGQQGVTASAVALPSNACKTVSVKALQANALTVYIGPTGVTTSTGFELSPGDGVTLPVTNTNLLYVIASGTGSSVSWLASN